MSNTLSQTPPPVRTAITLEFSGRDALRQQILDGILRSRGRLETRGFVDSSISENDFQGVTAPDLADRAVTAFWEQEPGLHQIPTEAYQFALRLLQVLEGNFRGKSLCYANAASDWETDRDGQEACDRLGIQSFEALQNLIANKYGSPNTTMVHLHKGPGDGSLIRRLRSSPPSPWNIQWQHIGIGCEIPFSIERILARFIRPNHGFPPNAFREFFKLFGLGLRRYLKPEWFNAPNSEMMGWQQKTDLCDLNLLYKILKDSALWPFFKLSDDLSGATVSREFPEDVEDPVPENIRAIFNEYRENPIQFLEKIFTEDFMRGIKADHSVLERLFMDNVARYRENSETPRPANAPWDLNGLAHVYPRDMILGFFDKIRDEKTREKDLIPEESVNLITSIRSDSHEDAETFKKDIENNLKLLRPGGVLLVDGIRSSYSRDYRYEEVREIMQKSEYRNEFKAEAVLDSGPRPLAVLIQRKHPNGYFSDDEKRSAFKKDVYFSSLEDIISRPDIAVLDNIRHRISAIAKGRVDIFRGLHQHSHEALERFLYAEALRILKTRQATDPAIVALGTLLRIQPETVKINIQTAYDIFNLGEKLTEKGVPELNVPKKLIRLRVAILNLIRGRDSCTRILDSDAATRIANQLAAELHGHVKDSEFATQAFGPGLKPLDPESIYTLPQLHLLKRGVQQTRLNRLRAVRRPRESQSLKARAEYLNNIMIPQYQPELVNDLKKLSQTTDPPHPPIRVIAPSCVTNDLLLQKLRIYLGEDYASLVEVIPIIFKRNRRDAITIENRDQTFSLLRQAQTKGSIFILGGSFKNPDSPEGAYFTHHIAGPILGDITRPKGISKSRAFGICFSHECFVDRTGIVWELMHKGLQKSPHHPIRTVGGSLTIGSDCPVRLSPSRPENPDSSLQRLFRRILPPTFPTTNMNSRHTYAKPNPGVLTPLAFSSMTDLPVAFTYGENDGVVSIQWHPEVSTQEDFNAVLAAFKAIQGDITSTFGARAMDVIRHNFGHVPPNFGDPLLFFILHHFAHELATNSAPELSDIEPYNPPRSTRKRVRRRNHKSRQPASSLIS